MKLMSEDSKKFWLSLISSSGPSSTRFQFLYSSILSNTLVFGLWGLISLFKWELQNIPDGVIWVYAAANGINIAGKVWSKSVETKAPQIDEVPLLK